MHSARNSGIRRAWSLTALLALMPLPGCSGNGPKPPDGGLPECQGLCVRPSLSRLDVLAGQPGGAGYVDGPSQQAHLIGAWGLGLDNIGHLFFIDGGNMVRAADLGAGMVSTLAGHLGLFGGMDGTGTAATFYGATNLLTSAGVIYLSDTENHILRRIDAATGKVTTLAGTSGQGGAVDAVGAAARFQEPEGLALVGDTLYVGDTDNSTIRRVVLSSGAVDTVAGAARTPALVNGIGLAARFNKPKAMVADGNGGLFILDYGNQCVRRMALADFSTSTLATFTVNPAGITVVGTDVIVSLTNHSLVRVAIGSGAVSPLCGTPGQSGFIDGPCAGARFYFPDGITSNAGLVSDGQGGVYVSDGNYVIRRVDLGAGTVTTVVGADSPGHSDGTGGAARFWGPSGVTTGMDLLYVADTSNHTLRQVVVSSGAVTTLAGSVGQMGSADGAAASARFNFPQGVAFDHDHLLYIADAGNRAVRVLDLSAATVRTLSAGVFAYPTDLTLDGAGHLYVTDSQDYTVRALDLATSQLTVLAGTAYSQGKTDGTGQSALFRAPSGITYDGAGDLYVADSENQSVRKIVIATGAVTTIAGVGAPAPGNAVAFNYPSYVAANGLGDLFISDVNNNVVRHLALATGEVTTVIGDPALSGVKAGPLPTQLSSLTALTLTADGHLALLAENAVLLAH